MNIRVKVPVKRPTIMDPQATPEKCQAIIDGYQRRIENGEFKFYYNERNIINENTEIGVNIFEYGTVVEWKEWDQMTIELPFENYDKVCTAIKRGVRVEFYYYEKDPTKITNEDERLQLSGIKFIYVSYNDILECLPANTPEGLFRDVIVRYHREECPELKDIEWILDGDYVDLRAAEEVEMKAGDHKYISLGVSMKLPKGYYAELVSRSGTFKNFGLIQANAPGIMDESYCGDEDIWRFSAIAFRDTVVHVNDRICQFAIKKKNPFSIIEADKLEGKNRGGLGSTGVK